MPFESNVVAFGCQTLPNGVRSVPGVTSGGQNARCANRNFNLMDLWQPRERPTRLGAGRNQLLTPLFSYGFAPCSNSAPLLVLLCVLFCISSRDPVHDAESLHSLFIAHDLLWTLSTVGDVTARRERQRSRLRISSTLQLLPGDLALAGQSLTG